MPEPQAKPGQTANADSKPAANEAVAQPVAKKRTYTRVKFYPKSHKEQPDDVILSVNGDTIIMMRDQEVVLPDYFLEAADHATFNQYKTGIGNSRKVIMQVRLYPYALLGKGTKVEYIKQRAVGTSAGTENRQQAEAVQPMS